MKEDVSEASAKTVCGSISHLAFMVDMVETSFSALCFQRSNLCISFSLKKCEKDETLPGSAPASMFPYMWREWFVATLHLWWYVVTHFTLIKKLKLLQFGNCTWPCCSFNNILINCSAHKTIIIFILFILSDSLLQDSHIPTGKAWSIFCFNENIT